MKDAFLHRPDETAEYYFQEGCHILESLNDDAIRVPTASYSNVSQSAYEH